MCARYLEVGLVEESLVLSEESVLLVQDLLFDMVNLLTVTLGVGLSLLSDLLDLLGGLGLLELLEDGSIGVELLHHALVLERVLLLLVVENLDALLGAEDLLDGVGVDQTRDVAGGNDGSVEEAVLSAGAGSLGGAELLLEFDEGRAGVDDEASDLTSGSEVADIQTLNVEGGDTWDVSEGADEVSRLVIDDNEGTSSELVSSVSLLSVSGSQSSGLNATLDIFVGTESLEDSNGVLGLGDLSGKIVEDERELRDLQDAMSSGQHQRGDGSGSDSAGQSVSSLAEVDLSVPSSPGLEGEGEATLTTHVSEGTLTGSVSSGSADSGHTGDGATSSPRFGRVLHTGLGINSVGLTGVFGQVVVDKLNDIVSDGGIEDAGEANFRKDFSLVLVVEYRDGGSEHRFAL